MNATRRHTVVGLGELLWDCFADTRRPGGAPANVAFHAEQLGHDGIVCSRVGSDPLGDELLQVVRRHGLETRHIQRDPHHPTGTVTVDSSRVDRPAYTIHEDVAWDHLECRPDWTALLSSASAVCFGTLAQRGEPSRSTIHRCLAAATNAVIVYDVNLRQSYYDRAWIERSLAAAHIVKLNLDEVAVLADLLSAGSAEPVSLAEDVRRRFDVRTVCVTRAEEGCVVIGPSGVVDSPGVEVDVVDAVGAGDAFTAAFISGTLSRWPPSAIARFANEVGAMVAGRAGAMPAIRDQVTALRERYARERVDRPDP